MTEKQKPRVVISGSFRKAFEEIMKVSEEFEKAGFEILSPKKSKVINPGEEFAILESDDTDDPKTDDTDDPKTLEERHLEAIVKADVLYIVAPDGYLGDSAKMELGFAYALRKHIYCSEVVDDATLKLYCGEKAIPSEIAKQFAAYEITTEHLHPRCSLAELQEYLHHIIQKRGFDEETPRDIMLLMVEEVGELAKALRKYTGLKVDTKKLERYTSVEEEIADVFIYLVDLANVLDASLFDVFLAKEKENEKRFWEVK